MSKDETEDGRKGTVVREGRADTDPLGIRRRRGGRARGELGPSFKYAGRSVNELIAAGLPVTAELGFYALLVAVVIGGLAGVMGAMTLGGRPGAVQGHAGSGGQEVVRPINLLDRLVPILIQ